MRWSDGGKLFPQLRLAMRPVHRLDKHGDTGLMNRSAETWYLVIYKTGLEKA